MNKDAEAIDQFLAWLTQEPHPANVPSGELTNPFMELEEPGEVDLRPFVDPLDSEVEAMQADLSELGAVFIEDNSSLKLGEIPAVQDRFHAIIKRRLRVEIERNPPLFPWETKLWDYETEPTEQLAGQPVPTFWSAQLQTLKLPVQLPETLLLQIFSECRQVVHASLRQGVKLVRAVEALFPEEPQILNHWASQVLAEPVRSSGQTLASDNLPLSYETASSTQQMVLSLLAARQVLESMTLEVSAEFPQAQRQWITELGSVVLDAVYQPDTQTIQIIGQLPMAGRLTLQGETSRVTATCAAAETLKVELSHFVPEQTYPLTIELDAEEPQQLIFAVHLAQDPI
jgi:hypothetical protein